MPNLLRHLPNALTCCNLICGCIATAAALDGRLMTAVALLFAAVAFDFVDGLAARLLHAASPIGKDLDSLADVVSFGLAPAAMLHRLFVDLSLLGPDATLPLPLSILATVAVLAIPVGSALRLAKFNNDARQTTSFIGLPVPAHAIFWSSLLASLARIAEQHPAAVAADLTLWVIGLSVLALAGSLLLVSELPMFSLKVKSMAWQGNERRYLLLIAAVVLTLAMPMLTGISATILLYILLSIFDRKAPETESPS